MALSLRWRLDLHCLPATLPVLALITFLCAFFAERWSPYHATLSVALLLPLLSCLWLHRPLRLRSAGALWIAATVLGWLYQGLINAVRTDTSRVDWGGWGEWAAAIALATMVLIHRPRPRRLLAVAGAAGAICLIAALSNALWGPYARGQGKASFGLGFGNINYLMYTCGPPVVAWLTLLVTDVIRRHRRHPLRHWVLALVGAAVFVGIAWSTTRRGALAALALTAMALAVFPLLRRWPATTTGALAVALTAAVIPLVDRVAAADVIPSSSGVRFAIYRSAAHLAADAWPWGLGEYGILHLATAASDGARRYTQGGDWAFHSHNEILEALIEGGLPGLLLATLAVIAVVHQVFRIRDPSLKVAAIVLAAMTAACAMISVVYGTVIGRLQVHLLAALILTMAPATLRTDARWLRRGLGAILIATVGVAGWWGAQSTATAFLHDRASMGAQLRAGLRATTPMRVTGLFADLEDDLTRDGGVTIGSIHIPGHELLPRIQGVAGSVGRIPLLYSRAATRALLGVVRPPEGTQASPEALHAARSFTSWAFTELIDRLPQFRRTYADLHALIRIDPELAAYLPERILRRLRRFIGDATLPPGDLDQRPDTVEGLADLQAMINWAILNDADWRAVDPALRHLVAHMGHVHSVAGLLLRVLIHSEYPTYARWAEQHAPMLRRALRYDAPLLALRDVNSPRRARAILPFLRILWPKVFAAIDAGRQHLLGTEPERFWLSIRLIRIHALAQHTDPDRVNPVAPRSDDRPAPTAPPAPTPAPTPADP